MSNHQRQSELKNTKISAGRRKNRLRRYLWLSIFTHGLIVLIITISLQQHNQQLTIQEMVFAEDLKARQEAERERIQEELRQAAELDVEQRLADQLQAEMDSLIADEIPPAQEAELSQSVAEQIQQQIQALSAEQELQALDFEALAEMSDQLREGSLEDMRAELANMKRDMLLAQVRQFIRNSVVPQIQNLVEARLKSEAGPAIETALARAAATGRPAPSAEAQREIVRQTIDAVREAVGEQIEKEIQETAVPAAAKRITQALDRELKKRKIDAEPFREFLEKDINLALSEGLKESPPATEPAMARAEQRFELRDAEAIDEARQAAEEVAKALAALAERQEQKKAEAEAGKAETKADANKAEMQAAEQRLLAAEATATQSVAERVAQKANRVTLDAAKAADEAAAAARDKTAATRANEAATSLERQQVEEAASRMEESAQALRQASEAMEKLAEGLAAEAAKARAKPPEPLDLAEALGEEKAAEATERTEKAGEKAAEVAVKKAVQRGMTGLKTDGILGEEADVEALAQMEGLEQKLAHAAELLAAGRGLAADMGAGLAGPATGLGGLGGIPGEGWGVRTGQVTSRLNRDAYERYMKHMRDRLNPDDYYTHDPAEVEGLALSALAVGEPVPAAIFVDRNDATAGDATSSETATGDSKPDEAQAERKIPEPRFPTLAFGAAAMMEKPATIDGDLSDWGELRHPLTMQFHGGENKIEGGPEVYVRWSPDGVYLGYTVVDDTGIQPCPDQPWNGDCLELMIDMANSRLKTAFRNPYAQKFCFTPFGCRGSTDVTVWEMGRGLRGLSMAKDYPDLKGTMGKAAAKKTADGYTVEIFLSRTALVSPALVPGKYIALNFSLNVDIGSGYQWSASQHIGTWQRPDTWGDVLLLGSDAKFKFLAATLDNEEPLQGVVPGTPLGLEILDADMNLNTQKVDLVAAELRCRDLGTSLFVILRETGPNTGLFRASVDTQSYFKPGRENTLNVRSGDTIDLIYNDARTEYGEVNRRVTAELPVAWPVLQTTAGK